ncbi:MAG: DUF4136 domain-containing protein [Tannerella sp.]|nr:DUF4136 domain-containing protein [Tannerella sp.]
MKKAILIAISVWNIITLPAQQADVSCRLGFSYEISNNIHWGKDKPVIMKVYPHSPAETAGIIQNDIIEKIDGVSVTEIPIDDVDSLLTATENSRLELTVRNFSSPSRVVSITKECYSNRALNESQLATAFAMYSLERTHDRLFICPFVTTTTDDPIDFLHFGSFDFTVVEDSRISGIESTVNEILKTELTQKGLQYNPLNPDFLIHTYYTFNENPRFKHKNKAAKEQASIFRYDITRDKVTGFPFYESSAPESEAEYILQLGIRFVDRRFTAGRILWECEANEMMSAPFAIKEYAAIHIPLMCMQYPYVKYNRNAQFILTKKAYNYTGINYGIYRLNEVVDVDPNSPAFEAGIRPHDIIEKIENKRMDHTAGEFTAAYHQFLAGTLKYRDSKTRFTDANGFQECMYWDPSKYAQITKAFNDDKHHMTAFSYLYFFEPYINRSGNSSCTFDLRRDGEKLQIVLRPLFHSEKTIELN